MGNIWIKAISILAGNLNSGLSYLITTVSSTQIKSVPKWQTPAEQCRELSYLGGVHKLRLQILPIFDHLPTSVYIG